MGSRLLLTAREPFVRAHPRGIPMSVSPGREPFSRRPPTAASGPRVLHPLRPRAPSTPSPGPVLLRLWDASRRTDTAPAPALDRNPCLVAPDRPSPPRSTIVDRADAAALPWSATPGARR